MHNNELSIGKLTSMIYRCTQAYANIVLKELELGSGIYPFLLILNDNEGINQNQISKELNVDKAMTARAIKQLIALGYLYKEADPEDSRAYNLFLTDKGKAVIPIIKDELSKWNDAITVGMSEDAVKNVIELLSKVFSNAKKQQNIQKNIVKGMGE